MKLYIRQKAFSLWDEFYVKDDSGADRYRVDGEMFAVGKKLHVYELCSGEEVLYISRRPFAFMPKVDIYGKEGGDILFTVLREFTMFVPSYYTQGAEFRITGNFGAHEYEVTCADRTVARVEKEWFTWGDSYALEFYDAADELSCLGILLAVDIINSAQAAAR